MNKTSIEWTDYTWNPVTGCHKVSAGCKNCYAETLTKRFGKQWGMKSFRDVTLHYDRLTEPHEMGKKLHGKKVFVCDMSDLFQEDVPTEFIVSVWRIFANNPDVIFQVLTKRPERALQWHKEIAPVFFIVKKQAFAKENNLTSFLPLPNVWIGVSCEDQATANERIPLLLQIPAAVRFLSCEPLLGPIGFCKFLLAPIDHPMPPVIHWVIAGGESGHNARPMHPDWVRNLRDQCNTANVPFFFKQWGEWQADYQIAESSGLKSLWLSDDNTIVNDPDLDTVMGRNLSLMRKVGKSKSGNLLDGVQHLNFPLQ